MTTDDDFRARPDPRRQLQMAATGQLSPRKKPVSVQQAAAQFVEACSKSVAKKHRGMNRTETEYADQIEARKRTGEVGWWAYESVTLKLAHDCRYTPDFCIVNVQGWVEFVEVKGPFVRDDSLVKLRVAARTFPWARFRLAQKASKKDGGGWTVKDISP